MRDFKQNYGATTFWNKHALHGAYRHRTIEFRKNNNWYRPEKPMKRLRAVQFPRKQTTVVKKVVLSDTIEQLLTKKTCDLRKAA